LDEPDHLITYLFQFVILPGKKILRPLYSNL